MRLCLRVAQHWVVIGNFEQVHVIGLVVRCDAAFKVVAIPLRVILRFEIGSTLPQELVFTAQQDHRVWVDVRLELGGILLGKFLWVHILGRFILIGDLVSIFIHFLRFRRRFLGSNEENFIACSVANGIAIEDVASVLTIVFAQSPAEGFT